MRLTIDSPGIGKSGQATDPAALDDALFGVTTANAAVALIEEVSCRIMPADIEAAFHTSHARYEPGGLTMSETTLLPLRGGLAFLDLVSSPLDMRKPQSSEVAAGWARWRENENGGYEIEHRSNGTWTEVGDRDRAQRAELRSARGHSCAYQRVVR